RDQHGDLTAHQIRCERRQPIVSTFRPAKFERKVATFDIALLAQALPECSHMARSQFWSFASEKSDHRQRRLLPVFRHPPAARRPAGQRDERPTPHSITSSARPISGNGIVRPSVLAVLRLMISSTLVSCWTGMSAGLSPLRMRPAYTPARRYKSVILPP